MEVILHSFADGGEDWIEAPSFSFTKAYLLKIGDKFDKNDKPINSANRRYSVLCVEDLEDCESERPRPNFSVSEFARLAVLMQDDEVARSMLFRLGQELRRAELDEGTTRDSLWGKIEERFNDDSVCFRFYLQGHVDEPDPLPLHYAIDAPMCCKNTFETRKRFSRQP